MTRLIQLFSVLLVVFALAVSTSQAGLVSTLTNADLEDPVLGNDVFAANPANGWSAGGTNFNQPGDDHVQHWDHAVCCTGIATSGIQFEVHRYYGTELGDATTAAGAGLWSFQSLGTVDAGDVGTVLTLSADVGIRSNSGHGAYTGTFTVAFRTGTSAASLGSQLGSTSSQAVANAEGLGTETVFTNTGDASYTVLGGEGQIFAVISSVSDQDTLDRWHFFVWDSAQYTLVPEPAMVTLMGLGGGLLLLVVPLRRRRTAV